MLRVPLFYNLPLVVEEVYVSLATKLTAQFSEKSPSQNDMHKCATGERCGMKTTPLDGLHSCMNCSKYMHMFCVWSSLV